MVRQTAVAADGQELAVRSGGQDLLVSWHPPGAAPDGRQHGAEGVCVTADGGVVLVSSDGAGWVFPAGRPQDRESWEETLRREVWEEACATVGRVRLLGFSRGACVAGPEKGLVLVRSIWRAEVTLDPWDPRFEMSHRRVVAAAAIPRELMLDTHPFAPIVRRTLREAALTGPASRAGGSGRSGGGVAQADAAESQRAGDHCGPERSEGGQDP